jgi:hypothetical protein
MTDPAGRDRDAVPGSNAAKDPDEWVTGDELQEKTARGR